MRSGLKYPVLPSESLTLYPALSGTDRWLFNGDFYNLKAITYWYYYVVGVVAGKWYFFGGGDGSGNSTTVGRFTPTAIGTTSGGTWDARTVSPVAKANACGFVNGTNIYVMGGRDDTNTIQNTNYMYDTVGNTWTAKAVMQYTVQEMSCARRDSGAAKAYVFGGHNGATFYDRCDEYDITGNSWVTGKAVLSAQRTYHVTVLIGSLIYSIGGLNNASANVSTVEAYDPTGNTWTAKASLPTALMGGEAGSQNGLILFTGWQSNKNYIYEPTGNTWTTAVDMEWSGGMNQLGDGDHGADSGMIMMIPGDHPSYSNKDWPNLTHRRWVMGRKVATVTAPGIVVVSAGTWNANTATGGTTFTGSIVVSPTDVPKYLFAPKDLMTTPTATLWRSK